MKSFKHLYICWLFLASLWDLQCWLNLSTYHFWGYLGPTYSSSLVLLCGCPLITELWERPMVIPAGSGCLCERSPTSWSSMLFSWHLESAKHSWCPEMLELPGPAWLSIWSAKECDASLSTPCFCRFCIPLLGRPVCLNSASPSIPVLLQITSGKLMTEGLLALNNFSSPVIYFGLIFGYFE